MKFSTTRIMKMFWGSAETMQMDLRPQRRHSKNTRRAYKNKFQMKVKKYLDKVYKQE